MVVAGVVALAAAPAATAQSEPPFYKPLAWYADEGAAVPATVDFRDVAANGTIVVAVGDDASSGKPVIYSRTGDRWTADVLPDGLAGTLEDVALGDGASGWAVGRNAAGKPLALQLASGTWRDRSSLVTSDGAATAVAVSGGVAMIGDSKGMLHRIVSASAADPFPAPDAGAINGIALFTDDVMTSSPGSEAAGIAVAEQPAASTAPSDPFDKHLRVYDIEAAAVPSGSETETPGIAATALAAVSEQQAVLIDSTERTRRLDGDMWEADDGVAAGVDLDAVGTVAGGQFVEEDLDWQTEFLVGRTDTAGAAWHRKRFQGRDAAWVKDALPAGAKALTGVAARSWDQAWAVGADGTILRYWRQPDLARDQAWYAEQERLRQEEIQREVEAENERQRLAEEERLREEEEERLRWEAEERRLAEEEERRWQEEQEELERQQRLERDREAGGTGPSPTAPPPPPAQERDDIQMNGIVIEDTPPPEKRDAREPPQQQKRLLTDVRAMRRGQKLLVTFRLTSRARVAITAKRGRKVIGKTRVRTLRKGKRTLVLRFRGKPPSSLKVVVRPAPAAKR